MKGTIAILGCLFAAYAAPLFANEVPLILEETIQLPVETTYWDVMPTWQNEYYWVACSLRTDTLSTIVFGSPSNSNTEVSIQGPLGFLSGCFVNGEVCALTQFGRSSIVSSGDTIRIDTTWVQLVSSSGVLVGNPALFRGYRRRWGYPEFNEGRSAEGVIRAFPDYPPPDQVTELPVLLSSSWFWSSFWEGNSGYECNYCFDILDSSRIFHGLRGAATFMNTWGGGAILYSQEFGHLSGYPPIPYRWFSFITATSDTLVEIAWHHELCVNFCLAPHVVASYDHFAGEYIGLLIGQPSNGEQEGVYTYRQTSGFTYRYDAPVLPNHDRYSWVEAVYVLLGSPNEQMLAFRHYGHIGDIYQIDTGELWGNTSEIEGGWSEMKIIGRYHNETRRLVVRNGSELRIYRFGEPIITDADDARPELPSELTLSAYPNPFNPTTMIAFDLPKAARAKLVVYDLNGRLVQTLLDEQMSGGRHEFGFDGAALPSGIYFARLSAGNLVKTQKMVLLK